MSEAFSSFQKEGDTDLNSDKTLSPYFCQADSRGLGIAGKLDGIPPLSSGCPVVAGLDSRYALTFCSA